MLIAGPNGTGKSTLLNALRSQYGNQGIMYVGPHRAMRRQNVQQRHLLAGRISVEELLQRGDIQSFEGISLVQGARDPWSYDDSANYLKHSLCQIEIDRTQAIASRYDTHGEILKGSVPDPWKPLRDLTSNLLPHLTFERIDTSNRDSIRCVFSVHSKDVLVDLDELSSGEKSIIQMFYPLVEHQIRQVLSEGLEAPTPSDRNLCVLIDEPELHLHPNLQQKVLDYLRVLTSESTTQVVLATHSPTMVESASCDELFLLRPVELVADGENQLMAVADDEDRLRFLRDVFGSTSNVTALQPIIVVEGVTEGETKRVAADRKLFRALHHAFDHVTILPGGGKAQCKALLDALTPALGVFSARLRAVALLDRDQSPPEVRADVTLLPVAMIENLLLDPEVIWEAVQSVVEKTNWSSADDIARDLDSILDRLEPEEVERLTLNSLGTQFFRPASPLSAVHIQAAEFCDRVTATYAEDRLLAVTTASQATVEKLRAEKRRREELHGKTVLGELYKTYLHQTGLQKGIFAFETARHARRRLSVKGFFDKFFKQFEA